MTQWLGNRVLVKPIPQREHVTASGIVALDQEAPDVLGRIVEAGNVRDVAVDDLVIFPPSAGHRRQRDGEWYLVLTEDELLGVWE